MPNTAKKAADDGELVKHTPEGTVKSSSEKADYDESDELDIHQMVREAKREYWEGKTTPLT